MSITREEDFFYLIIYTLVYILDKVKALLGFIMTLEFAVTRTCDVASNVDIHKNILIYS